MVVLQLRFSPTAPLSTVTRSQCLVEVPDRTFQLMGAVIRHMVAEAARTAQRPIVREDFLGKTKRHVTLRPPKKPVLAVTSDVAKIRKRIRGEF